jgi:membrane protein DedA with SNARE-associated domain
VLRATGFVLLGFAAGKAYPMVERVAGTAGRILLGAIVVVALAAWLGRSARHRLPASKRHGKH